MRRTLLASGFLLAAVAGAASAGGTSTVAVGATILSKNRCQFTTTGPTALAFGAIDPSSAANATATATTTLKCTGSSAQATYVVTADNGLYGTGNGAPRMRSSVNAAEFLPYTVNLPQSATVAKNVAVTLTITGKVLVSDFQNALAGAYSDTLTLTVTP